MAGPKIVLTKDGNLYTRYFIEVGPPSYGYDSFESYIEMSPLSGLNKTTFFTASKGAFFSGPYVDRSNYLGIQATDDMEVYSSGSILNGLNNGFGWNGSYVDHSASIAYILAADDANYASGSDLNGLNGGYGFSGSYVAR